MWTMRSMLCGWSAAPHHVGIADHDPAAVGLELFEHERAGAVGVARGVGLLARPLVVGGPSHAVLLRPGLRHDGDLGELQPQRRVRPGGRDADGVIVDRLDRGDAVNVGSEVGRLGAGALDAEDHVIGGERRAVVEGHVRAQLELPGGRVQRLPGQGELRHDRQVGIDVEQRLVDLLRCHRLSAVESGRMRVHGSRAAGHS